MQRTRSDLAVSQKDGKSPRVIIEIVVTHDVEEATEEKYRDCGIPVVKIRPTWETVDALLQEALGEETLNIQNGMCQPCGNWTKDIKRKLKAAIAPVKEREIRLAPINSDKFDARLRADTRRVVNGNARKLAWVGFQQQSRRPTLFKVPVDGWQIYADLDSTDVMRIWDVDCAPGLYAFPENAKPPKCRECVLEITGEILAENEIQLRRYFEDYRMHSHWKASEDY